VTLATFTNNGLYQLQLEADDGFATNTSTCFVYIKRRPSVILTAPTNNAWFLTNTIVHVSATAHANDIGASITNVEFWNFGTNALGSGLRSIYPIFALRWTTQTLLTNVLTAVASDSDG